MVQILLPAEPAGPSLIRHRVSRWLAHHGWPDEDRDDLVLAVNEAAANVVDHAYPNGDGVGMIDVEARIVPAAPGERAVEITVTDHGHWLTRARPRPNGGHGLKVMRACTSSLIIHNGADGTRVFMRSRSVPQREKDPERPSAG